MEYRERNGLDANEFEEHYWGRWFYPFNALALCIAAVPFALGALFDFDNAIGMYFGAGGSHAAISFGDSPRNR